MIKYGKLLGTYKLLGNVISNTIENTVVPVIEQINKPLQISIVILYNFKFL